MEAVECGAAALAIVLGYYRRVVPLATLRRDCGVSRDGSKCSNILKAARRYGLVAKAFRKDLPALGEIRYPYIVFWNFNHFLVVEGYRKGRVYLNDPACGPREVTLEEFDEAYTGVVIVLEPGPEFRPGGTRPSVAASLWGRLKGSAGPIGAALFTALLLVAPGLATPALMQAFVDKVLVQGVQDWGRPLAVGLVLAAVLRAFLTSVELRVLRSFQTKLNIAGSGRFVWHLLQLPASYYAQRYAGEVSSRIALNDKVAELLSGKLAMTAIDALMMIFYLMVMAQFDKKLAAVAVVFAAVNFGVLRWISRVRVQANYRLALHTGNSGAAGLSGLQSIRTLKASGLESDFFARWGGFFTNLAISLEEMASTNLHMGVLPLFLTATMTATILTAGGFEVIQGRLTIGQLVAFQALTTSFLQPVNNLVALGATLQELEGDLSRLDDVLRNPLPAEPPNASRARFEDIQLSGEIEFRNVSFGYSPIASPLIEDLSFWVRPGERVAFVGGSGSGKSTVAKLIAGIYEPTGGEILFDGIPAAQIPREAMTTSLAMVEQDILLFQGTVRENLTLWDTSIREEDLVSACEDALIDDAIRAMPDGYRSELLEGAANLSGGQRQRLEIARALAGSPSILVMDEATSALDAETELVIDRNIRRRGCTCAIVAHRLSTVRDSDEIIVLDQGRVVQRGVHDDLIRQHGLYARLLLDEQRPQEAAA
jgi:ATP-binding cassette subfamily C protein